MNVSVFRQAADGLSRERWDFGATGDHNGFALIATGYCTERRKQPKGRFANAPTAERWQASDERRYNSGLPRPESLPADVIDEAWGQVRRTTYIGFRNEECRLK